MLVILSSGAAPGLALLSYFYLKDRFDKESFSAVVRAFIFGLFLVFPLMFLQFILETEHLLAGPFAQAFFSASLLEEFIKWFFLLYLIYPHVAFDEPYDGIVFGSALSLGFATLENILYLVANGLEHALFRALLPVSSHALFGVLMGYYMGKAKFSAKRKKTYICCALFIPFLLHGLYDYILLIQRYWIYWILPFIFFLWWFGLRKAKRAKLHSDYRAAGIVKDERAG